VAAATVTGRWFSANTDVLMHYTDSSGITPSVDVISTPTARAADVVKSCPHWKSGRRGRRRLEGRE
jgi:hypothetical protein